MQSYTLLFFSLTILLSSCNGQTASYANRSEDVHAIYSSADTVSELGKNIMVIYQDKKSNYWFGSWENGVYRYDGKLILHFSTKNGLPDNRVDEIKEDHEGNVYVNTANGIVRFSETYFTNLRLNEDDKNAWKLSKNDLWFRSSVYTGSVYRFDGNNLYNLKLPKSKKEEEYTLTNLNSSISCEIYRVYQDTKGNVWFGTNPFGVCRFNGESFDWIAEEDVTELHGGSANGVRSIVEDQNGHFWFNSAYRYQMVDSKGTGRKSKQFYKRIKSIGSLDGKKEGVLNEYLSSTMDDLNNLWFATYTNGVWKYDGKKVTHYPVQVNSKDITLFYVYKDNSGDIWLGTHENGAFKLVGETFESFKP